MSTEPIPMTEMYEKTEFNNLYGALLYHFFSQKTHSIVYSLHMLKNNTSNY